MPEFKLLGKKEAVERITTQISSKKFPHALMLVGEKGIGKSVFADYVCKLLLCEGESAPCSECAPCKKIEKGIHPDIFKIYPEGKSETIGVKTIAPIKEHIYIKPNDAAYKIFIIYSAERMNRFAQNALLKMIEEPPEDTFFIFTCQNAQALLPTVRSRVSMISISAATESEIIDELSIRFADKAKFEIEKAAKMSGGNIGRAIDILSNSETGALYEDLENIAKALCDKDRASLCLALAPYSKKKEKALEMAKLLKLVFRDVCAGRSAENEYLSGSETAVKTLLTYVNLKSALEAIDACDEFMRMVEGNAYLPLTLTALEIRLGEIIKR